MHSEVLKALGYLYALVDGGAGVLQTVAHVHLNDNGHIVLGSLHNLFDTHGHEAHAVFERTSVLVLAMVEVGVEELVNEITMSAMYLHAIKTSLASKVYGIAKLLCQFGQLLLAQTAYDGGRIEVETCAGTHRDATADVLVAHVATMSQLNTCRGTSLVYGIGKFLQAGYYLGTHYQLTVETQSALRNGGVCYCGHTHTTTRHAGVIVEELLAGLVSRAHALEGSTAYGAVSQGERTYLGGLKYLVFHFRVVFL